MSSARLSIFNCRLIIQIAKIRLDDMFLNVVVSFVPDPEVALTSHGRGEAKWYKASFKLYRFIQKRNY